MANSYSTADVIKGALSLAGERTDGSSNYHALALKFIDNFHKKILTGPTEFMPELRTLWTWAKTRGTATLPVNFSTGSLTATNGSTTITFSSAPTVSLTNYDLKFTLYDTWYKITSHTANSTTATIDAAFLGTTASGLSFNAVPLEFDLGASIMGLAGALRITVNRMLEPGEEATDAGKIYECDSEQFWQRYPLRLLKNDVPSRFTFISRSESSFKIRFNKYVSTALKFDYDYVALQNDLIDSTSSIPLLPFEYKDILETAGAYYLLLQKKQPTEAQIYFERTKFQITAMDMAERKGSKVASKNFGRLIPRLDDMTYPYYLVEK